MWNQEEVRQTGAKAAPPADSAATASRKTGDGSGIRAPHFGRSVLVKGEVTSSEDLSVDGQVEGRIDLPDNVLTVGPNAVIHADITAKVVTIFGMVVGSVTARDKVDVRRGGSVEGNLACVNLAVQDGANICGKVETKGERRSAAETAAEDLAHTLAPVA